MSKNAISGTKQAGHGMVVILVVIVIAVIALAGWQVAKHHKKSAITAVTQPVSKTEAVTQTSPTSTDNASLQTDLGSVNNSVTTENSDGTNANTALNDQQNEVSVPTN